MKKRRVATKVVRALAIAFVAVVPMAHAVTVPPGGGVAFEQMTFDFAMPEANSDWCRLVADPGVLAETTGLHRGYVNVITESGWVVQNMHLDHTEVIILNTAQPPPLFTTYFSLEVSAPQIVTTLPAWVEYTPNPLPEFSGNTFSNFPVAFHIWNAAGASELVPLLNGPAPPL